MAEAKVLDELRASFRSGKTRSLEFRYQQIKQVQLMIEENSDKITEAICADLGGDKSRGITDMLAYNHSLFIMSQLAEWVKDVEEPHHEPDGRSMVRYEPKGVTLIISPFNFPFYLAVTPLLYNIAAGNCVIIKPSELSANTSAVLFELIHKYLDTSCFRVIEGEIPETTRLLALKFDHILYTGGEMVGKIVMKAAAQHLTPVTLELGGKSPAFVDASADLDIAAQRILWTKELNVGQICVATDYVFVHNSVKDELLKKFVELSSGGNSGDAAKNPDFGRIVSERHVKRIKNLVDSTSGDVIFPAGSSIDAADKFVPPTFVDNPKMDDEILHEEIFGPVLPVIGFDTIEEAVEKSYDICREPLGLYVYSTTQANIDYVIEHTQSGGVCVNSSMEHMLNPSLPFGGFGASGMGHYHGRYGFVEFSHARSIMYKDTIKNKGTVLPRTPIPEGLFEGFLAQTFAQRQEPPVVGQKKRASLTARAKAALGFKSK
mmetsp:Transcript_4725/g.8378  ORF Transcript_4725/g.8378 Transcript_4725/m.8378 type:complete len:490 (-) Transcript_4725:107-1576(-)